MSRPSLPSQSSGGSLASSSSQDDVRAHIVASLFSRYDETGTAEETLISFVKVHERDDAGTPAPGQQSGGGEKTRYLMLAVTKLGKVVLHKAKRNSNLTFSKGKTWVLEDVRVVEVVSPLEFALTMTVRRYQWSTERPKDQQHFVNSIIKVYKTYTKGKTPEMIGFSVGDRTPTTGTFNDGPDARRPSSSSNTSAAASSAMDLRPPSFKNGRSGSSSSMASGQSVLSSSYMSDTARRWAAPDQQTPTPRQEQFGRSPFADSSIPPARSSFERRPSAVSAAMQPSGSGSGGSYPSSGRGTPGTGSGNGAHALGLGNPPRERKDDPRKASEASIYPEAMVRGGSRDSRDQLRPIVTATPASPEQARPARPARAAGRNVSSASTQATPIAPTGSQLNTSVAVGPPSITTTHASPAVPTPVNGKLTLTVPEDDGSALSLAPVSPQSSTLSPSEHRPRRRASFHPPPLETAFSREVLLTSRTNQLPGAAGMTVDEDERKGDAIMTSVEEMLEGFDWTAPAAAGADGVQKRGADAIEARLMDELAALDSANIHAFLESDDRIAQVLGHIDEALLELDEIDAQITGYRMQLNAVTDDISFIESQNRGLQVQTSNQKALLDELRQLLQIAEVPPEDLRVLVHESPSSAKGVQVLERAAASLYKALQAGMDSANAEVQASIHRLREYQDASAQFCKRLIDYLEITFQHQSDQALSNYKKAKRTSQNASMLQPHTSMGEYLMMYEGLVLYIKEMDEVRYQRLCSNYFSTISALHQNEMKDMLMGLMSAVNASQAGEPNEASFASAISAVPKTGALAKSRAAMGLAKEKEVAVKEKRGADTTTKVGELYQSALTGMINQIITEEDFINAFLHLSDTESTFADHMELDSYFRRQAARHATGALSKGMVQLVRSMLDLVFGFLPQEFAQWCEAAVDRNPVAIISAIAVTERLAREAEEENTSIFFAQLFERLLAKQNGMLDKFINEQVKIIDNAKTNVRKRKGVAFFIRHFPTFVERVEAHLEGADGLPVRAKVDAGYEKVINAVFGSVSQIAKMDRAEGQAAEDKGQLNYHTIIIENMHHFVDDMKPLGVPSLAVYIERAKGLYEENMASYVKLILRRSFGRLMDFFDGIERQLQSTPANEVSLHSSYSKSALKKMLKDFSAKDMRKAVDTLSKRVDKHLIDETDQAALADPALNALITAVWRAVTQGLKDEVSRDEGYIKACYADSGVALEFGPGDVDAVCKRARQ